MALLAAGQPPPQPSTLQQPFESAGITEWLICDSLQCVSVSVLGRGGWAGITSLFLQAAMLRVLRYPPSSVPCHHMLYLLLSFVTFQNFVSPIFVTKLGSHSDIGPN